MASGSDLLLANGGELSPGMFPDDTAASLALKLDTWLDAGRTAGSAITDTTALETFASHWAYVLAYTAAINLRVEQEASATLATGESKEWGATSVLAMERRRNWHQDRVDALTPTTASEAAGDAARRISGVRQTRYRW